MSSPSSPGLCSSTARWACDIRASPFFDARAAFPNLLREMIWRALDATRIPAHIIRAVRLLCSRVW
eukprot:6003735-Pyramimonas_sp.AAC.1